MDKRSKIILILFFLVFIGIIVIELLRPRPVNWSLSYTSFHKRPWGALVLYEQLPVWFPNSTIIKKEKNLFETLDQDLAEEQNSALVLLNSHLHFDKQLTRRLLDYVSNGNDAFLAASSFSGPFADTLHLKTHTNEFYQQDSIIATFSNPRLPKKSFVFQKKIHHSFFESFDSLQTTVLATSKGIYDQEVSFIKIPHQKGNFFIHSIPKAFTNYYLLDNDASYAANCLAYLNRKTIYWDDYLKDGNHYMGSSYYYSEGRFIKRSPLSYILNQPALKWMYYLTIAGLIVFVLFRAKRKQRVIPIITPLQNDTVVFTKTIGAMFYQHKDYRNLAEKKQRYFTHYLRTHYYVHIEKYTEETAKTLAQKTGKPLETCQNLVRQFMQIKNEVNYTEKDLIALDKLIYEFK
ncbi:MAG: DUF4350 domain-containing protein [Flavobacteriaceae bacterium]|nr:DUF4350 domain-containing protein [Flavobacteriaceae bacterium]